MSSDYIVSIDMGTTKVSVLIGELTRGGVIRVIGVGTTPSDGMKKGVVSDMEQVAACVRIARDEAEKMAGVEIQGVCVGVSGSNVRSFNSRGVIAIPGSRREVTRRDVERVTETARSITLPVDREILHAIPQDFVIDNQGGICDPIGMSATRLEADVHIVTGQRTPIENLIKVLKKADLEVINIVFEPLAASRAVLTEEEMEAGCLLIDMGGGISSYAVYYGGCLRNSGVISAGGINITNDLAIGLRIPASVAETLKMDHGIALASLAGEDEAFEVPGSHGRGGGQVRTQIVAAIIEPRCEEIFTMVKRAVSSNPYYRVLGGGVILTGGGSRIRGMEGVAEQVFDLTVRTGFPQGLDGLAEIVCDEGWSTGVGLLLYEGDSLIGGRGKGRGAEKGFRWMVDGLKKIASLF